MSRQSIERQLDLADRGSFDLMRTVADDLMRPDRVAESLIQTDDGRWRYHITVHGRRWDSFFEEPTSLRAAVTFGPNMRPMEELPAEIGRCALGEDVLRGLAR